MIDTNHNIFTQIIVYCKSNITKETFVENLSFQANRISNFLYKSIRIFRNLNLIYNKKN